VREAKGPVAVLRLPALLCVLVLAGFAVFALDGLGSTAQIWVADLGELCCAALAAVVAGLRARASAGRLRHGWTWLALACGCWALGQGVWASYELILSHEAPFPSPADIGFLGFSVAAVPALWLLPEGTGSGEDRRRLLDGMMVACAIAVISWATALGAVFHAGGQPLELAVALAYPAGDVIVLTMSVLALVRGSRQRGPLLLVSLGMVAMALADSRFAYTSAVGSFETGAVDVGWCAAFLLISLSALPLHAGQVEEQPHRIARASLLPYLTLVLAGAVVLGRYAQGKPFDPMLVTLVTLLIALVLLRQWTAVRDNQLLLDVVADREAQLRHQAFHDSLTGLANRELFTDRVTHGLERCRRDPEALTVAFLDLDGFKAVNDTLGHAAGDELLVRVAERLRGALRAVDTLARLGGDEFAVLLERCGTTEALQVSGTMLEALHSPFQLFGKQVTLSASIGIASYEPGSELPSADLLLRQADVAMYDVKRDGKNGVRAHTPTMRLDEADDLALQTALADAIARRQVRAVFQPIVTLSTGLVSGLEVLARWEHEGQSIPPLVFVGVAERTGLTAALTDLMLDQACAQVAIWRAQPGGSDVVVGVNISPAELIDLELPARVCAALERHGIPAGQLLLEVTESGILRDIDRARAVMRILRDLGVSFAMDDFGTGYSSLSQLLSIPLDSVKVDRAFVQDIDRDPEAQRYLEGVLAFTRHVGLRVVVEGVERQGQLDQLRRMGCTWVQGYLLGRPVEAWALPTLPVPASSEP
jgi:diguanylate cyclase (GGDEF)-like protein